jgi:hypothetical protein
LLGLSIDGLVGKCVLGVVVIVQLVQTQVVSIVLLPANNIITDQDECQEKQEEVRI